MLNINKLVKIKQFYLNFLSNIRNKQEWQQINSRLFCHNFKGQNGNFTFYDNDQTRSQL
jgi:hypothetical protein